MLRVRFPFLSKFFSERDKSRQAGGHLRREERSREERSTSGARRLSAGSNRVISSVSQS